MFNSRRSRSLMKMTGMDQCEVRSMLKIAAAGYIAYHAAKFVVREIMD